MSLLNKASLIQIPSGYKDGTLYSAKPTNGDGDFTFSRGSNLAATRVNSEGLIQKGRENLLLQSNTFNTTWNLENLSVTSGQSGYDGSSDAWKVTPSIDDTYHRLTNSVSGASNMVTTLSVYAKADGYNFLRVSENATTGDYATFNLSNGSVANNTSLDAKIESIGNGWYRCSSTIIPATTHRFDMYVMETATIQQPWDGDGVSGILIQDAQLEVGLISTDVITTTTTTAQAGILEDMPRLDYSGGATCGSLILEPQRTNLITQSEYIGDSTYTAGGGAGAAITRTDNYGISPDGTQNATRVEILRGSSYAELYNRITTTGGETYTISFWAKSLDGTPTLYTVWNGDYYNEITFTNEWERYTYTFTASGTNNGFNLVTYTGLPTTSTSADLLIWGVQIELGSYSTSLIPTYGSSVTRGSDIATNDNVNLIGLDEFTFLWDGVLDSPRNGSGTFAHLTLDGTIGFKGASNTDIRVDVVGSGNFAKGTSVQTLTEGRHKLLLKMSASGTGKVFIDGSEISGGITYSGTTFTTDDGKLDGGSYKQNVNKVLVFPTALTDAECIDLTTI